MRSISPPRPGSWMVLRLCCVLTTMSLATIPPVFASGIPLNQDDRLEDIGQLSPTWFAELQNVELEGDRAYVFGVGGMAIYDISDPTAPVEMGRYEPPGHPYNRFYRGAVSGNLACGGGRSDRLTILNVRYPVNITVTAIHGAVGQSYEGATIVDPFIYACRHGDGLEIIDASHGGPTTAAEVTTLVNSWDVAVSGTVAYVADGQGGLAVIDITDPFQPVHVTSVATSGAAVDVVLDGTTAAVCVGSAGVDLFDLTSPLNPTLLNTVNTSGLAITAGIADGVVYVADWDDVEAYDISNPAVPVQIGGEDTPVRAMGLAARPNLVVVADWSRLRLYRPGASTRGDIHVPVDGINLGLISPGAVVDTTITISNTGNAPIQIAAIEEFGTNFEIIVPGPSDFPVEIPTGGSVDVTIRLNHIASGFESTFVRLTSDDSDENMVSFPISADDNPNFLNLNEFGYKWTHTDMDGVTHTLTNNLGRIVVMAFFANW